MGALVLDARVGWCSREGQVIGYSVRPISADPPRFAVFGPAGERLTRPLAGEESREQYEQIAALLNYARERALEERK